MNVLIEATGSLISGYLIKSIQGADCKAICTDISDFGHAPSLCDEFYISPEVYDPSYWDKVDNLLDRYKVDIVIPSLDETLIAWSKKKAYFRKKNIYVVLSDSDLIDTFTDKYKAFNFFKEAGIQTPNTSLDQNYSVVKPRFGRGGEGVYVGANKKNMSGMISQEYIQGLEYTVDCLFDINGEAVYIVPRIRMGVKDGKSTKGEVVKNKRIEEIIKSISDRVKFQGPINFQFIDAGDSNIYILEINPRIAGGMALGFAATENWIPLIIENFIHGKSIREKQPIHYGLKMARYYSECFI
jgi:carbamoyl-phosphate synthase large subunit